MNKTKYQGYASVIACNFFPTLRFNWMENSKESYRTLLKTFINEFHSQIDTEPEYQDTVKKLAIAAIANGTPIYRGHTHIYLSSDTDRQDIAIKNLRICRSILKWCKHADVMYNTIDA